MSTRRKTMLEEVTLRVFNPATGESIEEIATSSREELDEAVERARRGFREWREVSGLERAELFHEIAGNLRGHADELAEIMTKEGGKPFIENRDEVTWTAACFDYYGEIARDSVGYLPAPIEAQQLALVIKEPVGTVACIVPWNYPLLLAAWKVAPALAAGNAVILKPSEETPLATRRMAELIEGLPEGLLQVVNGAGDVGEMLVRHPGIDMVAFTGSQETGRKVGLAAAERLIPANLELGGKDPFIICDDVDIEVAAQGAVWAACLNAGQVCTSSERFYVMRGVADDFVEASRSYVESLQIGDPMDERTDIGPMINAKGREKVERHVGEAIRKGAKVVAGGERYGERGFFYKPTILTGVEPSMTVMRDETFGPVVPVVRVDTLDEAIEQANSVPYGLGANVYTRDFEKMLKCMREIRAGTVWINDPLTDNDAAPFGGQSGSGIGRELGREGLEAFQESKHVHIDPRVERKEWWYPYGPAEEPGQRTV
jgi:acyl-CoA reductase-like NAD-dependent aldehyde dehydrogenase